MNESALRVEIIELFAEAQRAGDPRRARSFQRWPDLVVSRLSREKVLDEAELRREVEAGCERQAEHERRVRAGVRELRRLDVHRELDRLLARKPRRDLARELLKHVRLGERVLARCARRAYLTHREAGTVARRLAARGVVRLWKEEANECQGPREVWIIEEVSSCERSF